MVPPETISEHVMIYDLHCVKNSLSVIKIKICTSTTVQDLLNVDFFVTIYICVLGSNKIHLFSHFCRQLIPAFHRIFAINPLFHKNINNTYSVFNIHVDQAANVCRINSVDQKTKNGEPSPYTQIHYGCGQHCFMTEI